MDTLKNLPERIANRKEQPKEGASFGKPVFPVITKTECQQIQKALIILPSENMKTD